jgi:hypothetical protein
MNRNIFEDLQSPFPSAPAGPVIPAAVAAVGPGGEAPPPYSTLPAAPTADYSLSQWTTSAIVAGYSPVGMKLCYVDFIPRLVRKRLIGRDEYETFRQADNMLCFLCVSRFIVN